MTIETISLAEVRRLRAKYPPKQVAYKSPAPQVETEPAKRKSGGRWTKGLKPCGTVAAYARHRRHGETPCGPCSDAQATYRRREYWNKQKKREGIE